MCHWLFIGIELLYIHRCLSPGPIQCRMMWVLVGLSLNNRTQIKLHSLTLLNNSQSVNITTGLEADKVTVDSCDTWDAKE